MKRLLAATAITLVTLLDVCQSRTKWLIESYFTCIVGCTLDIPLVEQKPYESKLQECQLTLDALIKYVHDCECEDNRRAQKWHY